MGFLAEQWLFLIKNKDFWPKTAPFELKKGQIWGLLLPISQQIKIVCY